MKAQRTSVVAQELSRGQLFDLFSAKDHAIVRNAIAQLEGHEHTIILMRFWENNTIDEIAEILDLTWQEVERYLSQALTKLKAFCLNHPGFSRTSKSKEPVTEPNRAA